MEVSVLISYRGKKKELPSWVGYYIMNENSDVFVYFEFYHFGPLKLNYNVHLFLFFFFFLNVSPCERLGSNARSVHTNCQYQVTFLGTEPVLTLKWSRGVPMDPQISFRTAAWKGHDILTLLFPDFYMLTTLHLLACVWKKLPACARQLR